MADRERDRLRHDIQQAQRTRRERLIADAEEAARNTPAGRREEARRQRELLEQHQAARQDEAEQLTKNAEDRTAELDAVLLDGLRSPVVLDIAHDPPRPAPRPFAPSVELAHGTPAPEWADFAPPPPGRLARALGLGAPRVEQARQEAQAAFDRAAADHRRQEQARVQAVEAARADLARRQADLAAEASAREDELRHRRCAFTAGEQAAVEQTLAAALSARALPDGVPSEVQIGYRADSGQVLAIRELPRPDVVPTELTFRYVKTRDLIDHTNRKPAEINSRYARLLAQVALLTLHDVFTTTTSEQVREVTVTCVLDARSPATGQMERQCLVSVAATRDEFDSLILAEVDPIRCMTGLNALVSPNPYDVEPVRPIFEPDLGRFRTIKAQEVAARLDHRTVLMRLTPSEFEHLIRELFEARGMTSWVTQASRDDGVDAVAYNTDPVLGGLCVIQAKRYASVVGADAVRALWGVMEDKKAGTGILVSTSYFGKATHEFAQRNERVRLIEGPHLKQLLQEHLGLDVLTGAKPPPASQRWRTEA
ncbi:restriction endonuclease [Actinomycetospora callitridis]|nr:restriction endonuclease [Actinomycetospora callitridis]